MSSGGNGERTEKPTAKRIREARKRGQFGRTPDLGAWLGLGAGVASCSITVKLGSERLPGMVVAINDVAAHPQMSSMMDALSSAGLALALMLAPVAAVTVFVAIAAAGAQGGLHFATEAAKPNFGKLNVVKGVKALFSPVQLWQLVKSLLKTLVIGLVLWTTIKATIPTMLSGGLLPLSSIIASMRHGAMSMVRLAVAAGLVLAAIDFVVAKRKVMRDLRMSKQEIKDENKASEGNPQIKAAIKSKQRAMSRNRMMAAIPTADVVLVNPTHVAVALRYDPDRGAPRVVAKGSGHVAARIRAKASEHGVPMVSDIPLARALHAACEVGQEIPGHLYVAVAQVLAFVMALRKRGSARGMHTSPVKTPVPVAS